MQSSIIIHSNKNKKTACPAAFLLYKTTYFIDVMGPPKDIGQWFDEQAFQEHADWSVLNGAHSSSTLVLSPDGDPLFANAQALALFGEDAGEAGTTAWAELITQIQNMLAEEIPAFPLTLDIALELAAGRRILRVTLTLNPADTGEYVLCSILDAPHPPKPRPSRKGPRTRPERLTEKDEAQQRVNELEHKYRELLEHFPEPTLITRDEIKNGTIVRVIVTAIEAFIRAVGYTINETERVIRRPLSDFYTAGSREAMTAMMRDRYDAGHVYESFRELQNPDGLGLPNGQKTMQVKIKVTTQYGPDGRAREVIGTFSDLSIETALLEQRQKDFALSAIGQYRSDDATILEMNPRLARILGYETAKEVQQLKLDAIYVNLADRAAWIDSIKHAERDEIIIIGYQARKKDGSTIWLKDHCRKILNAEGNLDYYLGVIEDITPQKVAEAEQAKLIEELRLANLKLDQLSQKDQLTGLLNRGGITRKSYDFFEFCERQQFPYSCIMFDIDHFKHVNDDYQGEHQDGDLVLKAIADCLRDILREYDAVCRYGGEEFLLYLPNLTLTAAQDLAERLRIAISELKFEFINKKTSKKENVPITISLGVTDVKMPESQRSSGVLSRAEEPDQETKKARITSANLDIWLGADVPALSLLPIRTIETNITIMQAQQRADAAMMKAKNNGRNRVYTYGTGSQTPVPSKMGTNHPDPS